MIVTRSGESTEGLTSIRVESGSPVLPAGSVKRYGVRVPHFEEDTWDLGAAVFRPNALRARSVLDFTKIREPLRRLIAKELAFAMLNWCPPGSEDVRGVATVYTNLFDLNALFAFIDSLSGVTRLAELTQGGLDAFVEVARHSKRSGQATVGKSRLQQKLSIVVDLWTYRRFLSYDSLAFEPWNGRKLSDVVELESGTENNTPRIPEGVQSVIIAWALRYVNEYSTEIISAREAQVELLTSVSLQTRKVEGAASRSTLEAIRNWLATQRQSGAGVPRHAEGSRMEGRLRNRKEVGQDVDAGEYINLRRIAHLAGVGYMPLHRCSEGRSLIRNAVDELGWEGDLDSPLPQGASTSLTTLRGPLYGEVLLIEERMLLIACYLLVAYLTGMRDSEVHSLEVGCLQVERSGDGTIFRRRLKGRVYKGGGAAGDVASWVAIEPAAAAVSVATRILEMHGQSSGELFRLPHGNGKGNPLRPWRLLNSFRDHVNRLAKRHPELSCVPEHEGESWSFTSMQLRRTLAWHIANLPYGIVALKIQYKHVHVATSEGYAGTSESGFQREIEIELADARMGLLLDRFSDYSDGVRHFGPAAARIESEFKRILREIGGRFAGTAADRARVRAMLLASTTVLYVGIFNDCNFVRDTALCLKQVGPEKRKSSLPVLALCVPTACTNAIFADRHKSVWEWVRDEALVHLMIPKLGEPQRVSLQRQIENAEKVLANWR